MANDLTPNTDGSGGNGGFTAEPASAATGAGGYPGDDPNSVAYATFGISGLERFGGISRVYEEFLKELQGPKGMRNLREFADNCPIAGAILFAANHLTRRVTFKFRPRNDSNEARQVADWVGSVIFDDMATTWPDTLTEILTMLPFGWSALEWTLKRRLGSQGNTGFVGIPTVNLTRGELDVLGGTGLGPGKQGMPVTSPSSKFNDGTIGYRSWQLRSQETLYMWVFDEESHATILQQMAPPDYRIRNVPLTKCLHFRTMVSKDNPEGRSILRNAWVSYYFKKNIQVIEGIGVERDLAGYPVIQIKEPDKNKMQVVPDIWNPKDPDAMALLAQLKKMVRSVRRDEQEGAVLPWWADFKLVSTGSRRQFDTNKIITRYDQRIAMSVMADFIMLGHEAVGSKALASTKISLFTSSLSAFLDTVCATVDQQGVLPLLRFNGIPEDLAPVMEHGDVESMNLAELGAFIAAVSKTGFNPLATLDAQKSIMDMAHLPSTGIPDPAVVAAQQAAQATQAAQTAAAQPGAATAAAPGINTPAASVNSAGTSTVGDNMAGSGTAPAIPVVAPSTDLTAGMSGIRTT